MANARFYLLQYELWTLGQLLDTIERLLVHPEYEWARISTDLQLSGAADDQLAVELAVDDYHELTDKALPRVLRGAYTVILWAFFEATVTEVAQHLGQRAKKPLTLADIRGNTLLHRIDKYWEAVLGVSFCPEPQRRAALEAIAVVRNVFAHAVGQIGSVRPRQRQAIRRLISSGIGLTEDQGELLLSESFVRNSYGTVLQTLKPLIENAYRS